jgi:hypothetical protein
MAQKVAGEEFAKIRAGQKKKSAAPRVALETGGTVPPVDHQSEGGQPMRVTTKSALAGALAIAVCGASLAKAETPQGRASRERRALARFANGSADSTVFERALSRYGHTERVQAILNEPLPAIGAESFRPRNAGFALVTPDGTIEVPPFLDFEATEDELGKAQAAFLHGWKTALEQLRSTGRPTGPCIRDLRALLGEWERVTLAAFKSDLRIHTKAQTFFRALRALVILLEDRKGCDRLVQYLAEGYSFSGGKLYQLIEHCRTNNLLPGPDSEIRPSLARLCRALECEVEQVAKEETALADARRAAARTRASDRLAAASAKAARARPANEALASSVLGAITSGFGFPSYRTSSLRTYRQHTYNVPTYRTQTYTHTYTIPTYSVRRYTYWVVR